MRTNSFRCWVHNLLLTSIAGLHLKLNSAYKNISLTYIKYNIIMLNNLLYDMRVVVLLQHFSNDLHTYC